MKLMKMFNETFNFMLCDFNKPRMAKQVQGFGAMIPE